MESQALRRLEGGVDKLVERLRRATERQVQLSSALVKSREEVERLRSDLQRLKYERSDTRKKVDALLRHFESLDLRFDPAER
jgi:chromosome segregation ATPase